LTIQQTKNALAAMRRRLALTEELLAALQYDGKYYDLTDYYTETMGVWPLTRFAADGGRYSGDDFWCDRPELCEKLDAIERSVKAHEWLCYIDNPAITRGLEYHADNCRAIIAQLESELS